MQIIDQKTTNKTIYKTYTISTDKGNLIVHTIVNSSYTDDDDYTFATDDETQAVKDNLTDEEMDDLHDFIHSNMIYG